MVFLCGKIFSDLYLILITEKINRNNKQAAENNSGKRLKKLLPLFKGSLKLHAPRQNVSLPLRLNLFTRP
jgi:type IV secretory pathway VirD2 relaxase